MTLRELAQRLTSLVPVHGDCDVVVSRPESEFLAGVLRVQEDVTGVVAEDFPVVVLHVEAWPGGLDAEHDYQGTTVQFTAVSLPIPDGKLADAELVFGKGLLQNLKLTGFEIWGRRDGSPTLIFPARHYSSNRFSLLRPTVNTTGQARLTQFILEAYDAWRTTNTP